MLVTVSLHCSLYSVVEYSKGWHIETRDITDMCFILRVCKA